MTGETETTTSQGHAAPWTQHAEDRTGGGGGRTIARAISLVAAVVPWGVLMAGMLLLVRAENERRIRFEMGWGMFIGGVVIVLVAMLLWAALTAWSSLGTTVAGLATLVSGVVIATESGYRLLADLAQAGPAPFTSAVYVVGAPYVLVPLGAVLVAAGLGAAGARRLGRRRA